MTSDSWKWPGVNHFPSSQTQTGAYKKSCWLSFPPSLPLPPLTPIVQPFLSQAQVLWHWKEWLTLLVPSAWPAHSYFAHTHTKPFWQIGSKGCFIRASQKLHYRASRKLWRKLFWFTSCNCVFVFSWEVCILRSEIVEFRNALRNALISQTADILIRRLLRKTPLPATWVHWKLWHKWTNEVPLFQIYYVFYKLWDTVKTHTETGSVVTATGIWHLRKTWLCLSLTLWFEFKMSDKQMFL